MLETFCWVVRSAVNAQLYDRHAAQYQSTRDISYQEKSFGGLLVAFQIFQDAEEFVRFTYGPRIGFCNPVQILDAARIDVLEEFVSPDLSICVKYTLISLALIKADQAVCQAARVNHSGHTAIPAH